MLVGMELCPTLDRMDRCRESIKFSGKLLCWSSLFIAEMIEDTGRFERIVNLLSWGR